MEIGEYVRTKDGIIGTLYGNYAYDENQLAILTKTNENGVEYTSEYSKDDIIKSSPNIIDLIEENDLVKIEYYAPSYEERITRIFVVDFKNKNDIAFENSHCNLNIFDNKWSNNDIKLNPVIKGIITHEQIESMEYKVKE